MLTKNHGPEGGWLVKCDGCGKEILAQIFHDRLVVVDRRHGNRHITVVPKCELLRVMGACLRQTDDETECEEQLTGARIPL